jgi:hypothetical protein
MKVERSAVKYTRTVGCETCRRCGEEINIKKFN